MIAMISWRKSIAAWREHGRSIRFPSIRPSPFKTTSTTVSRCEWRSWDCSREPTRVTTTSRITLDQPNPSVRQVTVEELEQILAGRGFTAQQIAQRMRGSDTVFNSTEGISPLDTGVEQTDLSKVELTERVSVSKLSDWTARYKSRNFQQSLIAVADASLSSIRRLRRF